MERKELTERIIGLETAALEEWNRGNPSPYLELYSQDFTYFDPMLPKRLDGFECIREMYEKLRGQGSVDRYEMIDPVVQHGDGMAVLTYNLHSWSGEKLWKWNCTEVYQLQDDDNWKIIHNHWSLTQPLEENVEI
ncbi:MAG: DUF4440 domain-containing protein [Tannerellaceae bacterium]|nr:DUF4440 domain-containing protein [Tannerellaceae bacterium]